MMTILISASMIPMIYGNLHRVNFRLLHEKCLQFEHFIHHLLLDINMILLEISRIFSNPGEIYFMFCILIMRLMCQILGALEIQRMAVKFLNLNVEFAKFP
jgi:hypothetical protein